MSQAQVTRHWKILAFLAKRRAGIAANQLGQALGINWRTIYRDLDAISAAGFPIAQELRAGTTFFSWTGPKLFDAVTLSEDEWIAIGMGAAALAARGEEDTSKVLLSLARRVSATPLYARIGEVMRPLPAAESSRREDGIMKAIVRAGAIGLTLKVRYRSRANAEPRERCIDPLAVFQKGDDSYVAAFCHERRQTRTFKLSRIEWARDEGKRFIRPEFSLEEYLRGSFGVMRGGIIVHVRLRFSPPRAVVAREHAWPAGTVLRELPRGFLEAELDVVLSEEIEHWLLSLGEGVQVLEPEVLQKRIEERLLEALKANERARAVPEGQMPLFRLTGFGKSLR